MNCLDFDGFPHRAGNTFVSLPHRLYTQDPWYLPEQAAWLAWQFDPGRNPFYQYGRSRQFMVYADNQIAARCAAAINPAMDAEDKRTGMIGFFESENDIQVSNRLISAALSWLIDSGVNKVYGPMDFSIWHRYRFKIDGFDVEPYFGEPYNKPYYAKLFQEAGFIPAGTWHSFEIDLHDQAAAIACKQHNLRKRLNATKAAGHEFTCQSSPARNHIVMRDFYEIVMESYADFFGFYRLPQAEFQALYSHLEYVIRRRQVLLASRDGTLTGFLIQYWDWASLLRRYHRYPKFLTALRLRLGPVPGRWVMFMIGIRQACMAERSGLGSALVYQGIGEALTQNATHLVYSLISEGNVSNAFGAEIPARRMTYILYQLDL